MISWWGSWWECNSFGFTCQCAQMQGIPTNKNVCNTRSSILWYVSGKDWSRFSTYWSQLKSQHTLSDCNAHPSAPKITADPTIPYERSHLLAPKPPEQYLGTSIARIGPQEGNIQRLRQRNWAIKIPTVFIFWKEEYKYCTSMSISGSCFYRWKMMSILLSPSSSCLNDSLAYKVKENSSFSRLR